MNQMSTTYRLGVDIGSTTVKVAVLDQENRILFSDYERHYANIQETLAKLLKKAVSQTGDILVIPVITGSGGLTLSSHLHIPFVQEVVAVASSLQDYAPQTDVAIELGGEDAKIIYFTGGIDQRMNGICAGGTGSFIDQMASLLQTDASGLNEYAKNYQAIYPIAARCGVFAKSDIQPLINDGATHEDLAASIFQAVVNQTISGLACGKPIRGNVAFLGGPLHFLPELRKAFVRTLHLTPEQTIAPEHSHLFAAVGAAMNPKEDQTPLSIADLIKTLSSGVQMDFEVKRMEPLFKNQEEYDAFLAYHAHNHVRSSDLSSYEGLCYLGIDAGSTTTKVALVGEDGSLLYRFYENNNGSPLAAAIQAAREINEQMTDKAKIAWSCSTGYGEALLKAAFLLDEGEVETISHYYAAAFFDPEVDCILDIGGQDMKCIRIKDGTVDSVQLNEACSSGCGSFIETFAKSLNYSVADFAKEALFAKNPIDLGTRCTVFMNSNVKQAQKEGATVADISAGLAYSVIKNALFKVIKITNASDLGSHVVVQGGTFYNDAVLRSFERISGCRAVRPDIAGIMGAFGAALIARERYHLGGEKETSTMALDKIISLKYTTSMARCKGCNNHCVLTVNQFGSSRRYISGNRCERGLGIEKAKKEIPNLFDYKYRRMFDYEPLPMDEADRGCVGIPRVLNMYENFPFWAVFFRKLRYHVILSPQSTKQIYELGIESIPSESECYPAKLVHGHVLDLSQQGVNRIFLPYILHMPTENQGEKSPYVCPVIMGYSMVVRNFQSPEQHFPVRFETPVFHWFTEADRQRQICQYAVDHCGATKTQARQAYRQAAAAIETFRRQLVEEGEKVIARTEEAGTFAVVLAGRPYHTDPLINHDLARMFTRRGIPVLTVDSLPGLDRADLHQSRVEITNDFHARMLSGAMVTAAHPSLEYVQIVSFGCGHDAILSDEIIRLLGEGSGKPPLILKMDESEAAGSLGIRVQSFIETVELRRAAETENTAQPGHLPEPYPAKYRKEDKKLRTVLVPNISAPVSTLLTALLDREGIRAQALPVGGPEQIRVGKKYTHNDICFPCQMVIGELIDALQKGNYPEGTVAVGMAKLSCDCRMANYTAILRKALDSAGFETVPILTTDPGDTKGIHPGVSMLGARSVLLAAWAFSMLDILEELCRKIRPYETIAGETNRVFRDCVEDIAQGSKKGLGQMIEAFRRSIKAFCGLHYDRSHRKPRVLVTGELLVNFHPGTNFHVVEYLEKNGMETILPRITYQFRKDFQAANSEIRDFGAHLAPYSFVLDAAVEGIQRYLERIAAAHPLYHKAPRPQDLYEGVSSIIPKTLTCGEGWLMAGEIAHYAAEGARSFIILQPFGCLPNHVCGRGVTKRLKELYPGVQILPLDLDPDTSYANVENRLQMLIMNQTAEQETMEPAEAPERRPHRGNYRRPTLSST